MALFLLAVAPLELEDLPVTQGVGELSDATFKPFIDSHKYVMVLYYSLTCGLSNKALEYYPRVAEKLAQENLKMPVTRLDVDRNQVTASEHGIKGVPMLRLYVKGYPILFQASSQITPNVVFEWVQAVLANKYSDELKSLEDVKEIEELDVAVIMYLPKGDVEQMEDLNHVAGSHEAIPFYFTHNEKHAKYLGVESAYGFVILRRFDDGKKIFGSETPIHMNMMADFLKMFSTPLIEELSQAVLTRYADTMGIALLYFDHGNKTQTFEEVKNVCFHRHTSVGCIFGDKDLHDTVKFMETIGADVSESRSAFLVQFRQNKPELYKFSGDFTFDNLDKFVVGFFQRTLPRFYKSELKEPEQKEMIRHIIGSNFQEMVLDSPHTVVVWVKADHCSSCGQWKPIMQDMQLSYAAQGGFAIFQIYGDRNEHPALVYESTPAILVYMKKDKSKPVEYKGNKSTEEFKEWLSKTLKVKLKDLKEQSEESQRRKAGEPVEEEKFEEEPAEEIVIDSDDGETVSDLLDEGTEL